MIKKRIILHKIGKYPCNPYRVIAYRYIAGKITGGGGGGLGESGLSALERGLEFSKVFNLISDLTFLAKQIAQIVDLSQKLRSVFEKSSQP